MLDPRAPFSRWDICSTTGARPKNDDYGLVEGSLGEGGLGACLADGIGSAQLGDAVARCACHVAIRAMRADCSAREAFEQAQEYAAGFIDDVDARGSGAAFTVVRAAGGALEVAWLGDVACFVARMGAGSVEAATQPHRVGRTLTQGIGIGRQEPSCIRVALQRDSRVLLCTDGVWDELSHDTIERVLLESQSPQEACARLVLGRQAKDNATALALFP